MSASMTSGTYPRTALLRRAPFERMLNTVWNFLKGLGERRARQHLLQLADQYQGRDPALARQLREAANHAGEV